MRAHIVARIYAFGKPISCGSTHASNVSPLILAVFSLPTSWIFPVFRAGRSPEYDTADLYKPLKVHESKDMGDKLSAAWENELKKQRETGRSPSLLRASVRVFGLEFMLLGIALFMIEVFLK